MKNNPIKICLLTALLGLSVGCKKKRPAVALPRMASEQTKAQKELSAPEKAALSGLLAANKVRADANAKNRRRDRADMVRPAHKGFKPSSPSGKLKLEITLKQKMIRDMKELRVRLELRNIGGKPFSYYEQSSFLRSGGQWGSAWSFYITDPYGKEERLAIAVSLAGPTSDPVSTLPVGTDAARIGQNIMLQRVRNELSVDLFPGESLTSGIGDRFLELTTDYRFTKRGTHRIRAVYQYWDLAADKMLRVESAAAGFEVLR